MASPHFGPGVVISTRYRIESQAGRGGASVVYRATDLRHDRSVAIKVLNSEFASENAARRFLQEIRFEAQLQHPNIVPLHDSGMWAGRLFCVMPFVEGETLRARLKREGALPVEDAARIASELADALAYAHRQGIVHRDVKPENVLLHEGHALLTDFGISRALEAGLRDEDTLTTPGIVLGTPAYMSPEQAGGADVLDGRSDIYTLGCVLYEMLTGQAPFTASSAGSMLGQHLTATPDPVHSLRPRVPEQFAATTERMLEKNPADRFTDADQVVAALGGRGPIPGPPRRAFRLAKPVVVAVTACVVLAAAAIAFWPGSTELDPNRVLVFPLDERGLLPAESGAGVEAAYMVSSALEHAEPLVALDAVRHLDSAGNGQVEVPDPDGARRLAAELGAARILDGTVRRDADSLRMVLVLRDVLTDSLVARRSAAVSTGATSLSMLSLAAVRAILPELIDPGNSSRLPIDALVARAHHPSALALWILGEKAYRDFRLDEAREFFDRALAADSGLSFAAARRATTAAWNHDFEGAVDVIQQARADIEALPPKYAAYVQGLDAFLRGAAVEAEEWFELTLDEDPDWAEAHAALGEVYYHLQPRAFNLDSLAEAHFRLALESDTAFAPPRAHLAEIAARHGDVAEIDKHLRALTAGGADLELLEKLRLMRDCAAGSLDEEAWRAAVARNDTTALAAARSLGEGAWQPGCAEQGLRALLTATTSDVDMHEGALWLLQGLFVSRGMPDSARALLDSMTAVDEMNWLRIFFALNTLAGAEMVDGAAGTDSLLRAPDGEYYTDLSASPLWILGVWNAWLGDVEQALSVRDALLGLSAAGDCAKCVTLAAAVDAHAMLAGGDSAGALAVYDTLFLAIRPDSLVWRFSEPLPVTRLRQAELHAARGEHFEAIRAASLFDGRPTVYQTFLGRSLEIRYRQSLAWGDRRLADGFRRRLERLGRFDVIGDPNAASTP